MKYTILDGDVTEIKRSLIFNSILLEVQESKLVMNSAYYCSYSTPMSNELARKNQLEMTKNI